MATRNPNSPFASAGPFPLRSDAGTAGPSLGSAGSVVSVFNLPVGAAQVVAVVDLSAFVRSTMDAALVARLSGRAGGAG